MTGDLNFKALYEKLDFKALYEKLDTLSDQEKKEIIVAISTVITSNYDIRRTFNNAFAKRSELIENANDTIKPDVEAGFKILESMRY